MEILKFYANWCGPCKVQDTDFKENPLDIKITSIDVENNDELVTRHKVTALPTLILLSNEGKELKRWVGRTKVSDIKAFIEPLLNNNVSLLVNNEQLHTLYKFFTMSEVAFLLSPPSLKNFLLCKLFMYSLIVKLKI